MRVTTAFARLLFCLHGLCKASPLKGRATPTRTRAGGLFFGWGFPGLQLSDFVVEVLLEGVGVGADYAAAVYENGGCAVDFELGAVGQAGVHLTGGLGSA